MASFPTLPNRLVPWTANALTMAVLACATWWSAGQRPGEALLSPGTLIAQVTLPAGTKPSKSQASEGLAAPANLRATGAAAVGGHGGVHRVAPDTVLPVVYQQQPAIAR